MNTFLLLCFFEFLGEIIVKFTSIPFSAPVLGGTLFFIYLMSSKHGATKSQTTIIKAMLSFLGLLFLPLVIKTLFSIGQYEADLPMLMGILAISTLLGIITTAGTFILLTKYTHNRYKK